MLLRSLIVSSLKVLPNEKRPLTMQTSTEVIDDTTLQQMGAYFHVQDRQVLLRYIANVMVSAKSSGMHS